MSGVPAIDDDSGLWPDAAPDPSAGWGLRAFRHLLPLYPDERVVPMIAVPPPPPLPAGLSAQEAATALAATYCSAVAVSFNEWRPARITAKATATIAAVADALRTAEVTPGAWILHSFLRWRSIPVAYKVGLLSGKVPPMRWVYRLSRVTGHASEIGQCKSAALSTASYVRMHPAHADLVNAWQTARNILDGLPQGTDLAAAQAAVAPYVSDWDARVVTVTGAVRRYQSIVTDSVRRGKWLWE